MNNVKNVFSIKDLENLSGIKAHTIRIWEKRYAIFNPERSQSNIRNYSVEELQKLLNISFLNNYGYKISRIADLSEKELQQLVKQVYSEKTNSSYAINILKIAMLNFDSKLFQDTYLELSKTQSFEIIFIKTFIPFLFEIGLLWQTASIKPVHEHFISQLIYQKIVEKTSQLQIDNNLTNNNEEIVVLFLPDNEVHEISLLFVNYSLLKLGYKTIYLGTNIPFDDLQEITRFYHHVHFVSHFTVEPNAEEINDYLKNFQEIIAADNDNIVLHVTGNQTQFINQTLKSVKIYPSFDQLVEAF